MPSSLDDGPGAAESPRPNAPDSDYLSALNPAQREAVEALDGPVLVLAGAGTGKTRVLTTRLAHLIRTGKAGPGGILAVTFTNKAAQEMQHRVERLTGYPTAGMAVGTFHSISARWLRRHAEIVGLQPNYTILDTDDQVRLLKQILSAENIDEKRWPARALATIIDRWKNKALTPGKVSESDAHSFADGKARKLYEIYQNRLKTLNAADFGDLILHMVTIFRTKPEILEDYHRRFTHILVDEYQDTNVAQYLWLRLLARASKNICCVGDDDQSIYGWRGAEVGNILRFEEDFPGAQTVRLEQNYRSTGHILAAASGLISANSSRLGKTLWTEADEGEKVRLRSVWDGREEARSVGDEIEALERASVPKNEIAVLVRAGFQTREFEERFITLGLPYRVVGGPRFYERKEIRDALAYLRVIAQPADDLAFERIVNVPKRGLGDATVQKLHELARAGEIPLTLAADKILQSDELRPAARNSLGALMKDFSRWQELAEQINHVDLAELVLEESGYIAMWQNDKSADAPGRLDNLSEMIRAMGEFEDLQGFLEHISLVMTNEGEAESAKVSIMTLHAAKGLEFDYVFLPGWEEGVFPNQLALDEKGLAGLEEERRLAYVGLTRAKKRAEILYAANRQVFGRWESLIPSRFVEELPADHIEKMSDFGTFQAPDATRSYSGGDSSHATGGWQRDRQQSYSPGWERARKRGVSLAERRGQRLTIDGSARRVKKPRPQEISEFNKGERVFHEKFGYGTVEEVNGDKLTVDFETSGPKKILDSFVKRG